MQRLFEWSENPSWGVRGTGLTAYIGTCKGCLSDQDIFPEKSEALDSHAMLEHAKVVWVIRTSLLRSQRHWTHSLCWNMQRLFEWSEHSFWEARGTGLTSYVGTCKGCLSDQDIPPEKSEALDSQAMLEHAKVVWVIRVSLLRNQRHWTHMLYWNMQRLFEWSGHLSWEVRGTGLTCYIGTCKGCLSDQDIFSEKSEALDSQPMLEHAKVVWVIRTSLRNQRHWTHTLCWNICFSEIDQKYNSYSYNKVHLPIGYFLNETFGQKDPLNMAQPTFCTSLVSKHLSIANLVESSTYILNLKSEYHIRNIFKHTS